MTNAAFSINPATREEIARYPFQDGAGLDAMPAAPH
jgi:hypothetical protein